MKEIVIVCTVVYAASVPTISALLLYLNEISHQSRVYSYVLLLLVGIAGVDIGIFTLANIIAHLRTIENTSQLPTHPDHSIPITPPRNAFPTSADAAPACEHLQRVP